jgi:hypothetical protein
MKLVAFTIVLDGEPFIERHLPVFQQLSIPWHWIVVEGASGNTADTSWCKEQAPRWSNDGTNEYLCSIRDRRVEHWFREMWANKTEMCNFAIAGIKEPCVLMQIDADEIWRPDQLEKIVWLFDAIPRAESIQFYCRYFVGPDLMLEGDGSYGNRNFEWVRAWRYCPGDKWASHEPPLLCQFGISGLRMHKDETRKLGLVFDHFPYVTLPQVIYKEYFYGYKGLVDQWLALQDIKEWPVPLSRFFAHVSGDLPKVVKV